jgi:hypothetical protein
MTIINTRVARKSWGVQPKGYPEIAAPGALYAADLLHHGRKTALLPACGGQTALRSDERSKQTCNPTCLTDREHLK